MILTRMPDLPPAPETAANAAFRRDFYARWGRENAVVCGTATRAEYAAVTQNLSIKSAWGGREQYFLPDREVAVDDDSLLILNDRLAYGSRLAGRRPVGSFAVFFRPGMLGEVLGARAQNLDDTLERRGVPARELVFSQHLRPHDRRVTPRLRHLRDAVLAGERDEGWLEQTLLGLLDAMVEAECGDASRFAGTATARASARRELVRRLRLAADFIASQHAQALTLDDMAEVACLSRYHFVRAFHRQFGCSPYTHLQRKRVAVAQRLLERGDGDRESIALRCGFGTRWSLQRALARHAVPAVAAATAQDPHATPG